MSSIDAGAIVRMRSRKVATGASIGELSLRRQDAARPLAENHISAPCGKAKRCRVGEIGRPSPAMFFLRKISLFQQHVIHIMSRIQAANLLPCFVSQRH